MIETLLWYAALFLFGSVLAIIWHYRPRKKDQP